MQRYHRQIVLPEIGIEGQNKLQKTSVLCIGVGGLGCPALLYLAAAGVGTIGVVDFDSVDESNLQRQILYTTDQIGQPKSISAKQKLQGLNPDIQINCYHGALDLNNIEDLFTCYDFVIDGTDNFATKFLINDAGVKFQTPIIYGAIQRFDGQVGVFDARKGACYRCLYPEPPKTEIHNCAESGVIGAVAGVIGTTQAMQVIMLAVCDDSFDPLISKLWTIDMRSMESQLLNIPKNIYCPICSKRPENITLKYTAETCEMEHKIEEITVEELMKLGESIVIDVREQHEWDKGTIPDVRLHALSQLNENILPKGLGDTDIVLYCQKGMRSLKSAQILKNSGIKNKIMSLRGGFQAYIDYQNSK